MDQIHAVKNLKDEDKRKMAAARDFLIINWLNPLTLKDLSHEVGTNEYYLKKQFKMVFGTTVFGYLQAFKIEKAKEMLIQQDIKIAEIAQKLGYKHATHFTAAFKKQVGILPNQFREKYKINVEGRGKKLFSL
jgi:AraC-like DNA-binding protein